MTRQLETEKTQQHLDETMWGGAASTSVSRLFMGALESFAERGFHGTTTRDIASRARLSPAAVYVHYRSKEELLHLIIRSTHEELLRRMKEAGRGHASPVESLKAVVKAHVVFHAHRYTAAKVANHELSSLQPAHRKEILGLRAQIEKLIDNAVTVGVRSGHFDVVDQKAANFAILSLGIGVSRWFRPGGRLAPEELGDLYADLVTRMLTSLPRQKPRQRERKLSGAGMSGEG